MVMMSVIAIAIAIENVTVLKRPIIASHQIPQTVLILSIGMILLPVL